MVTRVQQDENLTKLGGFLVLFVLFSLVVCPLVEATYFATRSLVHTIHHKELPAESQCLQIEGLKQAVKPEHCQTNHRKST